MWGRWSMRRTFGAPDSSRLPMCLRCCGPSVCARLIPALQVARLLDYAQRRGKVAQQLPLDEVCCKVGRINLQKFRGAQPDRYPCIAVETRDNPAGRPYRVLDGKHRIHRVVAEWLMQEQQQPQRQSERIYCSFIVFSVSEVVAAEALVLMPTWLLGRTRVRDGEQEQLDSGTVDCATWVRHNAAGLGLPPCRPTSTDQMKYDGEHHGFDDHTLHAPSNADVVEAARNEQRPLLC
jgi:hypothetical protein